MITIRTPPAVILAAGESRRMGGPLKPLLPCGASTFLETVIATLRAAGIEEIVVVLGCRAEEVRRAIDLAGVTVALNPDWPLGMLSSLRAGIRALPPDSFGVLVTLVDLPALRAESVRRIVATWREHPERIVRPRVGARGGHPVVFPRALFPEVLEGNHPEGPRSLLRAHADRLLDVVLEDPGVLLDVDTPEDLEKLGRRKAAWPATR